MRRAGALLFVGGWVGFLYGLAHLVRAWLYQHEGELGLTTDFTLRGATVCAATLAVLFFGRLLSWSADTG